MHISVINLFTIMQFLYFSTSLCDETEIDGKCIEYDADSFAQNINLKNHFVMFYAPWCSHCKRLHPTWEELADMLNEEGSRVLVAKVDCTKETSLCAQQDITGYPTLKYFSTELLEPIKFKGTRDLPTLTTFLNEQLGSSLVRKSGVGTKTKDEGAVQLTDDNYLLRLASGKHFVKFYAPWCGHCQKLAPIWEEVFAVRENDDRVVIAKVDCTVNVKLCKVYGIKSYPTILWIEDGITIDKYQGPRTLEDLNSYISDRLGGGVTKEASAEPSAAPPSSVLALTNESFHSAVSMGITFVKFFAPWCGHCKSLAPTWEDLGKMFSTYETISIAKVDCTSVMNIELCNENEVNGFPTLLLFKDGKKVVEYMGVRSLEDLFDFVVSQGEKLKHDEL